MVFQRKALWVSLAAASLLVACGGGGADTSPVAPIKTVKVMGDSIADSGTFGFKFTDAAGTVLLESTGWASGAEAGRAIGQLKKNGIAALAALPLVERAAGITDQQLADAFASLA